MRKVPAGTTAISGQSEQSRKVCSLWARSVSDPATAAEPKAMRRTKQTQKSLAPATKGQNAARRHCRIERNISGKCRIPDYPAQRSALQWEIRAPSTEFTRV